MQDGLGSTVGHQLGSGACVSFPPGSVAIYEQCCDQSPERPGSLQRSVQPALDISRFTVPPSAVERDPTEDLCTTVGFHFSYLHRAGVPPELSQRWWQLYCRHEFRVDTPSLPSLGELEGTRNCVGHAALCSASRPTLPLPTTPTSQSQHTQGTWSLEEATPASLSLFSWFITGLVGPSGQ